MHALLNSDWFSGGGLILFFFLNPLLSPPLSETLQAEASGIFSGVTWTQKKEDMIVIFIPASVISAAFPPTHTSGRDIE